MKSTRRGSDSPVHRREKTPRFQIPLDKWPLSPGTPREASGVPCLNPRRGLTLLSPVCRDPARSEEHTSELQSPKELVCRLLLEKKKIKKKTKEIKKVPDMINPNAMYNNQR